MVKNVHESTFWDYLGLVLPNQGAAAERLVPSLRTDAKAKLEIQILFAQTLIHVPEAFPKKESEQQNLDFQFYFRVVRDCLG